MVVLAVWSPASTFPVKSTVSDFEQTGQETSPKEAEKSSKQVLQKPWAHEVTWNDKDNVTERNSIEDHIADSIC